MSACMTDSYSDCDRNFERRSCAGLHKEADFGERSAENPSSPQINHEFAGIKSGLTVMNSSENGDAPICADVETEALAIFASPNPLSVLPMGAFPLTLVALGHVSRRNYGETVQ
jgi:hypothetical protein